MGKLLALLARLRDRLLVRGDVGARDDRAALRTPQPLDGELIPERALRAIAGELEAAPPADAPEHVAHAIQQLRSDGIPAFGSGGAGLEVLVTHIRPLERTARRMLDEAPPRLVRLDDHALVVQHHDLIVDRGEYGRVQHLRLAPLRFSAPQRGEVQDVTRALARGPGKLAAAHQHRNAPAIA